LHVLAEGKMRCLFSLVFGAGIILLTSRLEKRNDSADIYYRRTLWLLAFGIAHAYLLWLGDILYPYALCGLALYPFRKITSRALLTIGFVVLVLMGGWYIVAGYFQRDMVEQGRAAQAAAARGDKLSEKQEDAKKEYEEWLRGQRPTADKLAKDASEWRGSF